MVVPVDLESADVQADSGLRLPTGVMPHLPGQCVHPDERVRPLVQGPVGEHGHLLVQVRDHRRDLALRQLGPMDDEFHGAGTGAPLARAVTVTVVDSVLADLPILGVAECVGLRGQECVGKRLDHRAQQIGARRA